mmetsp:Transcript_29905/g.41332  ORF Transcript_29905/g.41332 Transcript_29905/m.41332 type:complete len:138 (+) Transcript_29905:56-469(+)
MSFWMLTLGCCCFFGVFSYLICCVFSFSFGKESAINFAFRVSQPKEEERATNRVDLETKEEPPKKLEDVEISPRESDDIRDSFEKEIESNKEVGEIDSSSPRGEEGFMVITHHDAGENQKRRKVRKFFRRFSRQWKR